MIVSNFSNVGNFLIFCQENLIIRAEKTFLRNITIWYAFYSKIANFSDFGKIEVFSRKPIYFFKKDPNFERLFQLHSVAILLQFGEKKSRSETWTNIMNATGKIG